MTETQTTQAIEADFVNVTNATDNVTPNVGLTLVFPLTRQKTAAALDISAMSVKRWIDALASHGRLCTDDRGKVTASGYEELHALALATRENGLTLAQYLETLPAEEELESVLPVETVAISIVEAHRDQVSALTNRSLSREAALKSEFFTLLEEERADQAFERDIDEMRLAQVRERAYQEFLEEERESLRIKRELKAMKLQLQMEGKQ